MKAYLIIDLKVVNLDGFMEYVTRIPAMIEKYEGQYLVQGVEPTIIEGMGEGEGEGDLERSVVLEFPSRTLANAFLEERSQSDLHDIWARTTQSRILLVDGCT